MRLLLFLLLLLPAAAAEPAPTLRQCTSNGCLVVSDQDQDGEYDWANVALVVGEQLAANANVNGSLLLYELVLTNEELGGHELEETLGLETHHTLAVIGGANATAGLQDAHALLFVGATDHETGETDTIVWQYAALRDTDADGVPDELLLIPPLP